MGETLLLFGPSINKSLRIACRPDRLTAEPGAIRLREIMRRTRIIERLVDRLFDPRHAGKVTYPLADLLRTARLFLGQGIVRASWLEPFGEVPWCPAKRNPFGTRLGDAIVFEQNDE